MTKRTIKNRLDELEQEKGDSKPPLILNMTGDPDELAELHVQPNPEHDSEHLNCAMPSVLPERWWPTSGVLFVFSNDHEHSAPGNGTVNVGDVWADMSKEELALEAEARVVAGDPIPPLLEPHVSN